MQPIGNDNSNTHSHFASGLDDFGFGFGLKVNLLQGLLILVLFSEPHVHTICINIEFLTSIIKRTIGAAHTSINKLS